MIDPNELYASMLDESESALEAAVASAAAEESESQPSVE